MNVINTKKAKKFHSKNRKNLIKTNISPHSSGNASHLATLTSTWKISQNNYLRGLNNSPSKNST